MNEESKYYTPTIEEFYIGFEYEEYNFIKRIWETRICEKVETDKVDPRYIRVKYLNRADVESLGFKYSGMDCYELEGKYPKNSSGVPDRIIYRLLKLSIPNKYEIRCNHPSIYFGNFLGYIKNLSELKILLKQLNIN